MNTSDRWLRRTAAGLLTLTLLGGLTACGDEQAEPAAASEGDTSDQATPSASPSSTGSTSPTVAPAEPGTFKTTLAGHDVQVRLADTNRFRFDGGLLPRLHFIPVNVAADPEAERWGDMFVWAPTKIYDPKTQKPGPLPAQPAEWLEVNPGVDVLRSKKIEVDGREAWQLDVERDGSELFGDADGGSEGDGYERFVLWEVDGTWLMGQASTFRGEEGLLAPDGKNDIFMSLLESVKLKPAS